MYKGDSTGKRLARTILWARILGSVAHLPEYDRRFAYLASDEGGDASTLLALGVPPERQLAIDISPKAIAEFKRQYPTIPTAVGDIAHVLPRKGKFAAIFFDSCQTGSVALMRKVAQCAKYIHTGGTLAYTVVRGREKVMIATKDSKQSLNDGRAEFYGSMLKALKKDLKFNTHTRIHYHSRTNDSAGLPMLIEAYTVGFDNWTTDFVAPRWFHAEQYQNLVLTERLALNLGNATTSDLISVAKTLYHAGYDEAGVLHLPKGTLAAMRAHQSRGTYSHPG